MTVVYSKYNRDRLPKFQIETTIFRKDGLLFVKKRPLTSEAIEHIQNMHKNYLLLKERYPNVRFAESFLEGDCIIFEYINGDSLDNVLINHVSDKSKFRNLLNSYLKLLENFSKPCGDKINFDSKYVALFGDNTEHVTEKFFEVANIDITFDNILIDADGQFVVFDYEWVFETHVPMNYVVFRSVTIFYEKYMEILRNLFSAEEILGFLGIENNEAEIYKKMEKNFQSFVIGESKRYFISERYYKEKHQFHRLYNNIADFDRINRELEKKNQELEEINRHLEYTNQQLMKDNAYLQKTITHLEAMAAIMKYEIYAMLDSKSWRITAPLRWGMDLCRLLKKPESDA